MPPARLPCPLRPMALPLLSLLSLPLHQLISIVAYHVSPTGAKDPAALAAVGELATALGGNVLLVGGLGGRRGCSPNVGGSSRFVACIPRSRPRYSTRSSLPARSPTRPTGARC